MSAEWDVPAPAALPRFSVVSARSAGDDDTDGVSGVHSSSSCAGRAARSMATHKVREKG